MPHTAGSRRATRDYWSARAFRPSLLTLACLLGGNAATAAGEEIDGGLFMQYELATGPAKHLTVLPGRFLDGVSASLAVVLVDNSGARRLHFYDLDGAAWTLARDIALPPELLFVDVAILRGRDRVITYRRGRLSWIDPASAVEHALVTLGADYRPLDKQAVPQVDITRDVNGDGRDDFLFPSIDGFWISLQSSDGSFLDAVTLGPPEPFAAKTVSSLDVGTRPPDELYTYADVGITAMTVPVYLGRVHALDFNHDTRSDLVFWNKDHFDVYLQKPAGQFSRDARAFTTDVPFDSDGVYSRAFDYSGEGALSAVLGIGRKTERTVLHSVADLNGDGVADLVTLTLTGRSITRQRSRYAVHFGTAMSDGIRFAREAGTVIRPRGRAGGMQPWGYASRTFEDLDGDGSIDLMFQDVAVGMGGMLRTLAGNSVPINLEFYRNDGGIFDGRPTTRRRIRRFAPLDGLGNIFFPPVLLGDVTGDGRSDLLVGQSPQALNVYVGVPGPDLFAREPQKIAVDLPYDERNTRLVALNSDRKLDVLVHHAVSGEPHRLITLISK